MTPPASVRFRFSWVVVAVFLSASSTAAATIDYVTAGSACQGLATCAISVDGVTVTLKANPDNTLLSWDTDGLDGIGIHPGSYEPDEIEAPEWLTIEFNQPVQLSAVVLTDLFWQEVSHWGFSASPAYHECGWYTVNGGPEVTFCQDDPGQVQASAIGWHTLDFGAGAFVTSIGMSGYGVTWHNVNGNANGYSIHHDFSLARLEFTAIPEPALLGLLALGLGAAAWHGRRRKP